MGTKERGRKKEKDTGELIWRMRAGGSKAERWIGREGMRDLTDMAHLLLLSGCCDIAGFPRSANCGK